MKKSIKLWLLKLIKNKILIIISTMAGVFLLGIGLYLLNQEDINNQETTKNIEVTTNESTDIIEETSTLEETSSFTEDRIVITPVEELDVQTNLTNTQQNAIDPEKNTDVTGAPEIILDIPETVTNVYYGIDVSRYQGTINWPQVKAAGVDFAIIRLGFRGYGTAGTLVLDSQFYNNVNGAIANGIDVGIYFFSQALNETEAAQEASMVIGYLEPYKNNITYPVAFDWEGYNNPSYRVYYQKNNWTSEKLNALSTTFCDLVKSAGYTPMHYGNKDAFNTWGFSNSLLGSKYKIWFSHPTSGGLSTPTDYTGTFQIWQYSFNGIVPGITGNVDLNVALGSLQLNVTNNELNYPLNSAIDFMDGVNAVSTIGTNINSSVVIEIKNALGNIVSQAEAIGKSGSYTIVYSVTDVFGSKKSSSATLNIY